MASLLQLSRDTAALQRGQLLARLKRAGVDVCEGETIGVDRDSIYARSKREWRKGGLVGKLRSTRCIVQFEDDLDLPDYLQDVVGILHGLSFTQPAGLGSILEEDSGQSVVFCILPACSPAESIRSTPRRPGAPSRSGC